MRTLSLLMVVVLLAGGCGGGGGYEARTLELGTDLLAADLDGDGRTEIVTLSHLFGDQPRIGRLVVHRRSGAGGYSAVQTLDVGCYPWRMQAADVDGDGLQDLLVTDVGSHGCSVAGTGDGLYLLLQDRSAPGRFLPPQRLPVEFAAYTVAVADFTGDGRPDLAFGRGRDADARLVVLPQDAAHPGRFGAPIERAMPGDVSTIASGDVDGDGRADLLCVLYAASTGAPRTTLALLRQLPGGGFGALLQLDPREGLNVERLAIRDVDGDGRADLLVRYTPYSTDFRATLAVLLQRSSPQDWAAPVDSSLADIDGTSGSAFGDLDGDGLPDVALAGTFPTGTSPLGGPDISAQANVLQRSGRAGYRLAWRAGLPIDADTVAIGDVDGDGRNDLVVADGEGALRWMRQSPTAPGQFGAPQPLP